MRRGCAVVGAALLGMLGAGLTATAPAAASAPPPVCAPGVYAEVAGPPPALAAMGMPAGERYTGPRIPVTVAVVDSGVDATRAQLRYTIAPGSTSLIDDGERRDGLSDPHGHGTAIAGIIAARPSDRSGVVGVAPRAHILSVRVFRGEDQQSVDAGWGPQAGRVAQGIRLATDAGAQVIAVALSDETDAPSLRAATAYATEHGALVVASAGNRSTASNAADSPRFPAGYPAALGVTAVDVNGVATDDSIHGAHVDVAAPGQDVLTTSTGGGDCVYAADAPSSSFATGYVAGAAALLAEAFPAEGPAGWAYRLKASAQRSNPDARTDTLGWGVIRPAAALDLRPDRSTRGPASPFADTSEAAFEPPVTTVSATTVEADGRSAVTAVAVGAAGVVTVLGLIAILRRRSVRA
ncbi:S8 family serine peptidase [Microbacterium sp.]|uniref:S8 family serine peptidase n=1 Tax=Microbacterium sp. TaxID=51671 RepID=UPI003A883DE1